MTERRLSPFAVVFSVGITLLMLAYDLLAFTTPTGSGAYTTLTGNGAFVQASSTPAPSGCPALAFGTLAPNYEPPACFRPFASSSPWNQKICTDPCSPTLAGAAGDTSNSVASTTEINFLFQSSFGSPQNSNRIMSPYSATYYAGIGGQFPFYFSKTSDVAMTINCTAGYSTAGCAIQGKTFYIPANAQPAPNSDAHMTVIQPDGTEVDMFGVAGSPPWTAGTLSIAWGGSINMTTASGWEEGSGGSGVADAAGSGLMGGVVRIPELQAGVINHALTIETSCQPSSSPVYPAQSASVSTSNCGAATGLSNAPHQGARFWLSTTDAQISALSGPTAAQKTVLHALHQYGAFLMDTTNCGPVCYIGMLESPTPGYTYGSDTVTPYAVSNIPYDGYTYDLFQGSDITSYIQPGLKVLAPCVSTGYPGGTC